MSHNLNVSPIDEEFIISKTDFRIILATLTVLL